MAENNISSQAYEIGFGKPPKSRRYKKGQSGNPSGRPKGAKSLKAIVRKVVLTLVPAVIGSKRLKITTYEAALRQLANKAASGDLKAIAQFRSEIKEQNIDFTKEKKASRARELSPEELSKLSVGELQNLFNETLAEQKQEYIANGKSR
jgi:Family of unknown function (DUF5681)